MRKKRETLPLPKPRGRPKNSGLIIPHWAHKAIAALSESSGVTSQKILETALKDGIQTVGEPLAAWINYQKSSDTLFHEHTKSPEKVVVADPEGTGQAPTDAYPVPLFNDRLRDADLGSGFEPEVQENNGENIELLAGE